MFIKSGNYVAIPRQANKLQKRRNAEPQQISCCGLQLQANTGVYDTAGDSELMVETVKILPSENFLEIGCGSGVVSILLGQKALSGQGVDINDLAVDNSKLNAKRHGVINVEFYKSDVFEKVKGMYDVIVCNPPYTNHAVSDDIDRMFWDPKDEMKRKFFKDVGRYLKPKGRIYFGWANFGDIDVNLPLRLAENSGLKFINISSKPHTREDAVFFVLEFVKQD